MSRLGCKCGCIMSSSNCPSPNIIKIFTEEEITSAINYNRSIKLIDFETDWDETQECQKLFTKRPEPVEYWYCNECNRVYEVSLDLQRWIRVYYKNELPENFGTIATKKLFVFTDKELEDAETENDNILLNDFISKKGYRHYCRTNDDNTKVIVFDSKNDNIIGYYELEEIFEH